ncbi:MAG: RNA polymerase sigma factor, partial [Phycisphaerae bacterium]
HRSPHAAAEHNEDVGRMLAAMKLLPDNQQEVLLLKFQNGFSYKEISNITGHSVSYVGVLIHTAVKALRNRMTAARPSHRGEQS